MKYDYYVKDDYGDVWNEEAFNTFGRAYDFRQFIRPLINRITSLTIFCVPRGESIEPKTPSREKENNYAPLSDF